VKRAAEVCNYFPIRLEDGTFTTPFELVHKCKPDLRVLFKLFSLAAVHREREGDSKLNKFETQSIPMIAVGHCPSSNGLQFYNPANGTLMSPIDYKLQPNVTSGSKFGYQYQPGTFIYRLDESTTIFAPTFTLESKVLVHTHSPPHVTKVIGIPTYDTPNRYIVSFKDGSILEYDANVLSALDESTNTDSVSLLPTWIKPGANATLFLNSMVRPRHGKLQMNDKNEWIFCPGNMHVIEKGFLLPDLTANCHHLLESCQLFKGHAKFRSVYNSRNQIHLRDCVLRHVSAHGLRSLVPPSSLSKIASMDPNDQAIWYASYDEEYDGLADIPTWDIITEDRYQKLKGRCKAIPSMAIAVIKYDENNCPKRAKFRIVVLGNLDYHQWSKETTYAPVLSQLELRLPTSLAVHHKRVLKNADVYKPLCWLIYLKRIHTL
jgi:hypothetical protein